MKNNFYRTPGSWSVGTAYSAESTDLYLDGARWTNPDSSVRPSVKGALVAARLSNGQIVGLALGGVYAAPAPE